MIPTPKQEEALRLLKDNDNVLLYGGARSGKTAITIYFIIWACMTYPGAEFLITRRYATDIRNAVWGQTLPKILIQLGLKLGTDYKTHEQQMECAFPNGSKIMCAGLDDKERVDKILGTEYAGIYMNEIQDIPWSTVDVITTRLSQRIKGFRNRFFCDLNPTSINHWSYKLWFEHVNPKSGQAVVGEYVALQMNPYDNQEHLGEDYIRTRLETLTGQERNRMLLGVYSSDSDLQVFVPTAFYDDFGFAEWANGRWKDVRVSCGLDLGFEDADAFAVVAYIDGDPNIWLIREYKGRKNSITELAEAIKTTLSDVFSTYPLTEKARSDMDIWTDTGGLGRKTAAELADTFGLPVRAAYKRDKEMGIHFLRDDVNAGRIFIPKDGIFHDETRKTVWERDKETGKILQVIDDDAYHPDLMDAIIYIYRYLMKHGNCAMINRAVIVNKEGEEEKSYLDIQSEVMGDMIRTLNEPMGVW